MLSIEGTTQNSRTKTKKQHLFSNDVCHFLWGYPDFLDQVWILMSLPFSTTVCHLVLIATAYWHAVGYMCYGSFFQLA